eukprot:6175814-Pleurochrysis_carterae.AAC.5
MTTHDEACDLTRSWAGAEGATVARCSSRHQSDVAAVIATANIASASITSAVSTTAADTSVFMAAAAAARHHSHASSHIAAAVALAQPKQPLAAPRRVLRPLLHARPLATLTGSRIRGNIVDEMLERVELVGDGHVLVPVEDRSEHRAPRARPADDVDKVLGDWDGRLVRHAVSLVAHDAKSKLFGRKGFGDPGCVVQRSRARREGLEVQSGDKGDESRGKDEGDS